MNLGLDELLKNNHDFKKLNPSLESIRKALKIFGDPQDDFESIIIAGTNGKGSVCTFIEQFCLNYTELKVAKFTSPHLISVTERIQIQGTPIPENDLAEILMEIKLKLDFELSYFEKLTLAAFIYYSRQKIDLAILEVGMGGRWDCANVISDHKRKATAITSISLDHVQFLGDTPEKIRIEKEAIKRDNVPHFDYKDYKLEGTALEKNYQLALEIFKETISNDISSFDEELIFDAFKTSYQARFHYFKDLNIFLDSAHNEGAAVVLNSYLKEHFKHESIELHLAFLDKDYISFFNALEKDLDIKKVFIYQLEDERAADSKQVIKDLRSNFKIFDFEKAELGQMAQGENLKVYTGSIYFCGKVLKLISKKS